MELTLVQQSSSLLITIVSVVVSSIYHLYLVTSTSSPYIHYHEKMAEQVEIYVSISEAPN